MYIHIQNTEVCTCTYVHNKITLSVHTVGTYHSLWRSKPASQSHTPVLVWILSTTVRSFVNQTRAALFHPAVLHWEVLPML